MPTFTSSPEDRAFEQLNEYVALKRNKRVLQAKLPGLKKPDPPEAVIVQWYLDRRKQKGRRKRHDLQRKIPSGNL